MGRWKVNSTLDQFICKGQGAAGWTWLPSAHQNWSLLSVQSECSYINSPRVPICWIDSWWCHIKSLSSVRQLPVLCRFSIKMNRMQEIKTRILRKLKARYNSKARRRRDAWRCCINFLRWQWCPGAHRGLWKPKSSVFYLLFFLFFFPVFKVSSGRAGPF